jgi:hypothetical protein
MGRSVVLPAATSELRLVVDPPGEGALLVGRWCASAAVRYCSITSWDISTLSAITLIFSSSLRTSSITVSISI